MVQAPRGKFVIFNNEQFSGDLTERIGSVFDVKRLTQLARCLQMQPVVYKDLTAKVKKSKVIRLFHHACSKSCIFTCTSFGRK